MIDLNNIQKLYFLGIGGIGMSALARYFNSRGVEIHGYDRTETALTRELEAEGMVIHYEDDPTAVPQNTDLVIYTPAVPRQMMEYQACVSRGYMQDGKMLKRAQVLGLLSRDRRSVAVAGTHGKTTTSTLITYLLREGGLDCSAFLGGISRDFGTNFLDGKSDIVVVEADEYDRSFLQLYPHTLVLTAMDPDHLDIYGTPEDMKNAYEQLISQIQDGGNLFFRFGLQPRMDSSLLNRCTIKPYGVSVPNPFPILIHAENLRVEDGYMVFDYVNGDHKIEALHYSQPGKHNVENAVAAISVALSLGVSEDSIRNSLKNFKGIWRRFEFILRNEKNVFIDDYAHHPEELKAAISAARMLYPTRKITGIFQPHLFTRTRDFQDGFAEALDMLDECILLDIYPARELPIDGITSEIIFDKMNIKNKVLIDKSKLISTLGTYNIDVLLSLGAGDIDKEVEKIKKVISDEI